MSVFTGSLVIEEIEPGRRWRLVEPLRYEMGEEGSGKWIEVPADFATDGASIPAVLRVVLAVWGTYGRAACLHDYLYSKIRSGILPPRWRRYADREFFIAMRACGTAPWLARLLWLAVRLFGAPSARGA